MLGRDVAVADSLRARQLGLSLLRRGAAGEGLLIPRCRCVHTFGMRFALDLVFIDEKGGPIAIRRAVPVNRVITCRRAVAVLELPSCDRRTS
jgi:uncharacterized membrane protein (UPF0127 family)